MPQAVDGQAMVCCVAGAWGPPPAGRPLGHVQRASPAVTWETWLCLVVMHVRLACGARLQLNLHGVARTGGAGCEDKCHVGARHQPCHASHHVCIIFFVQLGALLPYTPSVSLYKMF
jgi:hypothetical protein